MKIKIHSPWTGDLGETYGSCVFACLQEAITCDIPDNGSIDSFITIIYVLAKDGLGFVWKNAFNAHST
jgi:hypothetical protein